jgi:hypothetical protein
LLSLLFFAHAQAASAKKDSAASDKAKSSENAASASVKPGGRAQSDKAKSAGKNDDVAGIVLDKIGDWSITKDNDTHSIAEGDSIHDGWTLKQTTSNGTISVLLNNGKVMKCPDINGACLSAIHVAKPTGWYDNLVRTAMRLVSNDPDRFVASISRDSGGLVLSDGVVLQQGSKIDLSAITKNLPDGKYTVELIKQNSDGGKNGGNPTSVFEVKAHKLNKLSLSELDSDVYRLQITSQQDSTRFGSAYVYLADRGQYPQAQEKFSAFVTSVGGAQQELNGPEQSIVRAFIFAFAEKDSPSATD